MSYYSTKLPLAQHAYKIMHAINEQILQFCAVKTPVILLTTLEVLFARASNGIAVLVAIAALMVSFPAIVSTVCNMQFTLRRLTS